MDPILQAWAEATVAYWHQQYHTTPELLYGYIRRYGELTVEEMTCAQRVHHKQLTLQIKEGYQNEGQVLDEESLAYYLEENERAFTEEKEAMVHDMLVAQMFFPIPVETLRVLDAHLVDWLTSWGPTMDERMLLYAMEIYKVADEDAIFSLPMPDEHATLSPEEQQDFQELTEELLQHIQDNEANFPLNARPMVEDPVAIAAEEQRLQDAIQEWHMQESRLTLQEEFRLHDPQ